ncbi:MAG: L-seryl-tRNA(Sec) selenium transferase [Dehalococcoidia bacterium]
MPDSPFRTLPSVEAVIEVVGAQTPAPRSMVVEASRAAIDAARTRIRAGNVAGDLSSIASDALQRIASASRSSLVPVINAAGVVLHTNLGRAPLSHAARDAMEEVARGYSSLEFDIERGERGSRHLHIRDMVRRATGAQDAIAVNNNAAALFMVLNVFAQGREVVVSRGQAVEIGGGFRIPDVLRQSGATLVEVGTTNRTYIGDYGGAIRPETAALLRVHTSNFKVVGFTHETTAHEMVTLARGKDVLVFDDLGSGCLLDTEQFGMDHEPTVQESISAGVDLALFSGDKLLGGPQCGIVAGRADLIEQLRRHPLARALRVDKLTIAALNATLKAYVEGSAADEIPIWAMLGAPLDEIRRRARRWARAAGSGATVVAGRTMVGGGSLPGQSVATWCVALHDPAPNELAARLRQGAPAVISRIEHDAVLLDPRTVPPADDRAVEAALRAVGASD